MTIRRILLGALTLALAAAPAAVLSANADDVKATSLKIISTTDNNVAVAVGETVTVTESFKVTGTAAEKATVTTGVAADQGLKVTAAPCTAVEGGVSLCPVVVKRTVAGKLTYKLTATATTKDPKQSDSVTVIRDVVVKQTPPTSQPAPTTVAPTTSIPTTAPSTGKPTPLVYEVTNSNYADFQRMSEKRPVFFLFVMNNCPVCDTAFAWGSEKINSLHGNAVLAVVNFEKAQQAYLALGNPRQVPNMAVMKNGQYLTPPGAFVGANSKAELGKFVDDGVAAWNGSKPTVAPTTPAPSATVAPTTAPVDQIVFEVTNQNYRDLAKMSDNKLVIWEVGGSYCDVCKKVTPVLEKKVREQKGKVLIFRLDTEKAWNAYEFLGKPAHVPYLAPMKKGQVVDPPGSQTGYSDDARLLAWLDKVLAHA